MVFPLDRHRLSVRRIGVGQYGPYERGKEMTKTYKVPGAFYEDHMSRYWGEKAWADYDRDTERWSGNYVHITLTEDQAEELRSDAEFYAEGGGGFGFEYQGIMRSAAATVRWLDKQSEVTA